MDPLAIAVTAFVAGFLTCATAVGTLVVWSFSDLRVRAVATQRAGRSSAR